MKVVILAAGLGSRLGAITENIPKPLVELESGRPILSYIIDRLPSKTEQIIIVIKHLSHIIKDWIKINYPNKNITFIEQSETMPGTGGAIMSCAPLFNKEDKFLVINGDDILHKDELETFTSNSKAMGVCKKFNHPYFTILSDDEGYLNNMRKQTVEEKLGGVNIATGSYVLDGEYFNLEQVINSDGQYSIPATLLKHKDFYKVKIHEFSNWLQINSNDDLEIARKSIVNF